MWNEKPVTRIPRLHVFARTWVNMKINNKTFNIDADTISRFHEGLMFPEHSETFWKFRNRSVDFIILHRIWVAELTYYGQSYLNWHYWTETIRNNYIIKRPIPETFRNFRNASESFGKHNPSWKRPLFHATLYLFQHASRQSHHSATSKGIKYSVAP